MKKTIKWIVILLVLGGIGYGYIRHKAAGKNEVKTTYTTVVAESRDLRTTVESTGEIEPRNRLDVKPPIAGRLEELLVDEGDPVNKGQIIGWISSTERATLLDAALATSEAEMEYWQKLYKPTPLISPLKGTIIARNFEPGQSITASDAVVVIADDLIVVANLDETDIGQIKVGQKVRIRLEAYPDQEFTGVVEKIAYDATTISNVTMYQVDVRPDNIPDFARSGMTADLEFIIREMNGVLAVPMAAIQRQRAGASPAKGTTGPSTYVLVGSGKGGEPRHLPVETGLSDGSYTEVTSGLKEGEEVLIPSIANAMGDEEVNNPFMPNFRRRSSNSSSSNSGGGRRQ